MLGPRFAKVMLERYRKENPVGIADSGRFARIQETKFGWGHETWVKELSSEIKNMHFDASWTPNEVLSYVSKFVQSCAHQSPSSVNHERKKL